MSHGNSDWLLTRLVLEMAKLTDTLPTNSLDKALVLVPIRSYDGLEGKYQILGIPSDGSPKPLVDHSGYRLYVVSQPSGRVGLMKIAASVSDNELIQYEWKVLSDLSEQAKILDQEAISFENKPPFYGTIFPNPIEIFTADKRKGFFFGFNQEISRFEQLSPLSILLKNQRVDLQTCVWILGKLLKLLVFIHENGYANRFINPSNILVETKLHGVFCLDWSHSCQPNRCTPADQQEDIHSTARLIWKIAGGNETNPPVYDPDILTPEQYNEFVDFLHHMRSGIESARYFHTQIYQMADRFWSRESLPGGRSKRQFHTFSTFNLN